VIRSCRLSLTAPQIAKPQRQSRVPSIGTVVTPPGISRAQGEGVVAADFATCRDAKDRTGDAPPRSAPPEDKKAKTGCCAADGCGVAPADGTNAFLPGTITLTDEHEATMRDDSSHALPQLLLPCYYSLKLAAACGVTDVEFT
jgi:hypothetical protein